MRILYEFFDGPRECAYLPERQASLRYQLVQSLEPQSYEALMACNVRKFGQMLFSPECGDCRACQAIRVLVKAFKPDRSMKRCLESNSHLLARICSASNGFDVIELYNKYHQSQVDLKKWDRSKISRSEYRSHFLESDILIEEISLTYDGKLVALLLFEELTNGLSLIYHFYDPSLRKMGLGKYLILKTIELAKQRSKDFVYLGYYVSGCQSMEYKSKFKPNQILINGSWDIQR